MPTDATPAHDSSFARSPSSTDTPPRWPRRAVLAGAAGAITSLATRARTGAAADPPRAKPARIAITLDLEMSAQYPQRGMTEWNYEKGNLDEPTKRYALEAARLVSQYSGKLHFFCVGRVLEQPDIKWLQQIAELGHPIGNHTYDHVFVKAAKPEETQFRFQRSPWLVAGQSALEIVRQNIRLTNEALRARAGVTANGFRTPGGFNSALDDAPQVQALLQDLGFRWVSSKYPPHPMGPPKTEPTEEILAGIVASQKLSQPYVYPSGLVEVPMSAVSDVTAFRSNFWRLEWFLKAIRRSVEWAIETGGVFDFLAHPSCLVVEDPEFASIRLICELVKQAGERARLVGLDEIAADYLPPRQ